LRILVTGGAGFIGANLVRQLLGAGHQVRVLDNFSAGQREYLAGLTLEVIEGDILDSERVVRAVDGMEGVVHLAAQTGVPGSLKNPRLDCDVNVVGTLNMLEACRHAGVRRFVFASSNAPLGRQPPPATEDKAPLPISPYGASKLAGEGYCLAYYGSWGQSTVVLRFANIYGPYSAHKNSVVAQFFRDILTVGQIAIDGDGHQTRDFIYVGDLCQAIGLALAGTVAGEVFQIATGVETSIAQLADRMQAVVGRGFEMSHGPSRLGDIPQNYSDIAKATRILGWRPTVDLDTGLCDTWEWFRSQLGEPNTTSKRSVG